MVVFDDSVPSHPENPPITEQDHQQGDHQQGDQMGVFGIICVTSPDWFFVL